MGANGCVWARMGAIWYRGTGGHENKASIKENGCAAHNLGPMAGEISPDIMFLVVWQKNGGNECRWVYIGFGECG